jgi:hypothetical protein
MSKQKITLLAGVTLILLVLAVTLSLWAVSALIPQAPGGLKPTAPLRAGYTNTGVDIPGQIATTVARLTLSPPISVPPPPLPPPAFSNGSGYTQATEEAAWQQTIRQLYKIGYEAPGVEVARGTETINLAARYPVDVTGVITGYVVEEVPLGSPLTLEESGRGKYGFQFPEELRYTWDNYPEEGGTFTKLWRIRLLGGPFTRSIPSDDELSHLYLTFWADNTDLGTAIDQQDAISLVLFEPPPLREGSAFGVSQSRLSYPVGIYVPTYFSQPLHLSKAFTP